MLAVLVAVRDFLVAMALAWLGVSMETRTPDASCNNETCQAEQNR